MMPNKDIFDSEKYTDDKYEYREMLLPMHRVFTDKDFAMDGVFFIEDLAVELEKRPCNFAALDLWDFQGKSLSSKKTLSQLGINQKMNVLEFDQHTFNLIKKEGNEDKNLVKVDFVLNNWDKKKGAVLSPIMVTDTLWWRIEIAFPKIQTKASEIGVFLGAGGGVEWSCNISGNLILVNQDDRSKDVVRSLNTKLTAAEPSWGFADMFKLEDIKDPDSGFIKDGTIICKTRVLTDSCQVKEKDRFAQMLEKRNRKQKKIEGSENKSVMGKNQQKSEDSFVQQKKSFSNGMKIFKENQPSCMNIRRKTLANKVEINVKLEGDKKGEVVESVVDGDKQKDVIVESDFGDEKQDIVSEIELQGLNLADGPVRAVEADICTNKLQLDESEIEMPGEDSTKKTKEDARKRKKIRLSDKCRLPSCNKKAKHRCSRCLAMKFCSQQCSDQHWPVHREECTAIMERKERHNQAGLD
eukprot:GFUD01038686.1.p1 GENE.GFUD01038686.1~~GFUD01038686.1.p1  ORF type:complete len:468 (+),score=148.40 GFUD01038686.1:67-1470(+)